MSTLFHHLSLKEAIILVSAKYYLGGFMLCSVLLDSVWLGGGELINKPNPITKPTKKPITQQHPPLPHKATSLFTEQLFNKLYQSSITGFARFWNGLILVGYFRSHR